MVKHMRFCDRVFTCLHNSSLRLNRHFFLIPLRLRIRQILLYFRSALVYLLLLFMGKIRREGKNSLFLAKAADIEWRKMQWRIYAKWRQWRS